MADKSQKHYSSIENLFYVGYHKGVMDFGVNGAIGELSYEEMTKFREMIIVGIGTMEGMWRGAKEKDYPTAMEVKSNGR